MQVVRAVASAIPGSAFAPLYGIIAPSHDFTKYNRERVSSGVAVSPYYNTCI